MKEISIGEEELEIIGVISENDLDLVIPEFFIDEIESINDIVQSI